MSEKQIEILARQRPGRHRHNLVGSVGEGHARWHCPAHGPECGIAAIIEYHRWNAGGYADAHCLEIGLGSHVEIGHHKVRRLLHKPRCRTRLPDSRGHVGAGIDGNARTSQNQ